MPKPPSARLAPIRQVLEVMRALRAPDGCPWDREQDHHTLRWHAVEEVYELLDAIEAGDEVEMVEELGDLLLQVVFHAQLGSERGSFDFDAICRSLVSKLVRRHPHVFGDLQVRDVDQVWANWERIKRSEKEGSIRERKSALDGIPRRMPGLMRAQKLVKKASKAGLPTALEERRPKARRPKAPKAAAAGVETPESVGEHLFGLAALCQERGWSAEDLLRAEIRRREKAWRGIEREREGDTTKSRRRKG